MSPVVPSLPPHLVQLGFDYVLAVETGDGATTARFAPEAEQLPGLLPAIDEVGVIYLRWCVHRVHPVRTQRPSGAPPLGGRCTHRCGWRAGVAPRGGRGAVEWARVEAVCFSLT
ncbi:hypothetical protein [Streptomyces griseosporeus]|uniref:hypothetical protein n=1 Tax=Streptomyces griseosporeus TaxID=1910 RepID=UPI00167D2BC9|nr:hypothetical protein [Streptomyces griseosporeus]GHF36268.1 hypothetical protein GCM10018783_00690 [Streptomyces griseosporeus]